MARDILAIFDSEQEVLALRPDFARIAALDCFAVIVSARGDSQTDSADFVSRFFAPGQGVPEDPVTGSAHCTLTPYWSAKLGKTSLAARQVSARGGDLRCEMNGDRVVIAGNTAEYLRGEITIDLSNPGVNFSNRRNCRGPGCVSRSYARDAESRRP